MTEQIFSDGVASISVIGATVRLDFFTLSSSEKDANGQFKPVIQHRLIMSLPGFLQMSTKLQEAAGTLGKISAGTPGLASLQGKQVAVQDAGASVASSSSGGTAPGQNNKSPFP